jgi:hypothetical protein
MAVLVKAAEVASSVLIMFYSDDGNLLGASEEKKRVVMTNVDVEKPFERRPVSSTLLS